MVLDIPKALNINYSAYYDLSNSLDKYSLSHSINPDYYNGDKKEILFNSGLVRELLDGKTYLYLENLKKNEKNKELVAQLNDLKIKLCFSIFDNNNLVAILVYGDKQNNSLFHHEDLEILNKIIKEAESQINNIDKVKAISDDVVKRYQTNYQTRLLEESKRLGEIRDLKNFSDHSVKIINRLLHSSETKIYLYDEENKIYYNPSDADSEKIPAANYLIKYLTEKKELVLAITLERWSKEVQIKELVEASETAKKMKASIIIPLLDISQVLGFLIISNKTEVEQKFTQDDFLMLSFICDKVQTNLANIYSSQKANIDDLTKIPNRRSFEHQLEAEITQTRRTGIPTAVALVDVDSFKFFNDAGGHENGDLVLKGVANALRDSTRPTDKSYRYGGDRICNNFSSDRSRWSKKFCKKVQKNIQKTSRNNKFI